MASKPSTASPEYPPRHIEAAHQYSMMLAHEAQRDYANVVVRKLRLGYGTAELKPKIHAKVRDIIDRDIERILKEGK